MVKSLKPSSGSTSAAGPIKESSATKEIKVENEGDEFDSKKEAIVKDVEHNEPEVPDRDFEKYCKEHKLIEYHTTADKNDLQILLERNYLLSSELGKGGFGTVYKVKRTTDEMFMACKKMNLLDTDGKKRHKGRHTDLMNELFVLDSVKHLNIIGLYDQFIIDNDSYVFLELADSGNLANYVRAKKAMIKETKIKKWFIEICHAIQFMHQNCIANRDIKLNNIILSKVGKKKICKVADFGLSRICYDKNTGMRLQSSHCGTAPYMAPDILYKDERGKRYYNAFQADIWALGICLYALANRAYPYNHGDSSAQALARMCATQKARTYRIKNANLSAEVVNMLSNLLEPDSYKRITMNGIFSHKWVTEGKGFIGFSVSASKTDTKTTGSKSIN